MRKTHFLRRNGFTLVELLIVIAIIAVLIGLLVPAVNNSRESGNRTACSNNLRQVGIAATQYLTIHKNFPAGSTTYDATTNSMIAPLHNWVVSLLPYMDQDTLFQNYGSAPGVSWFNKPVGILTTRLPVLECPSSAQADRLDTKNPVNRVTIDYCAIPAALVPNPNPPPAAVVLPGILRPGATPNDGVPVREITDGVSNTILVAERGGKPEHWVNGKMVDPMAGVGGGWADHLNNGTPYNFNGCSMNCDNDGQIYSFHSRGANTLFADGSVRFLRASVSPVTIAQLVTYAGREVIQEDY